MPQPKYLVMYILAFIVVIAIVSSIPGLTKSYLTQQDVESRLLVGTNVWTGYEPFFLAQSLGRLPGEKIRLVEYSSATQVARALSNNVVDSAALTLDEALRVAALGIDIEVILVLDISFGGDVILAHPDYQSFRSLKGERIGVESTALGALMLERALAIHEMTKDDVTIVSLEVDEHEDAIMRGAIEAVVTFDPVASRLRSAGFVELFSSKDIPGEIVDVLVVRSDKLPRHRESLALLTNAWFKALEFLSNNPRDAHQRMAPRLNTSVAAVAESLEALRFPSRQENMEFLREEGELDETIDKILPAIRDVMQLDPDAAAIELANPEFLEHTAP